jgi:YesN/AraC family two-component response regulator
MILHQFATWLHLCCKKKYETVEASDGLDGLNKAKLSKFDLVITDVNMPKMDGIA